MERFKKKLEEDPELEKSSWIDQDSISYFNKKYYTKDSLATMKTIPGSFTKVRR